MTTKASHKAPSRVGARKAHAPAPVHSGRDHPRSVPIENVELAGGNDAEQPFAEGARDAIDPDLRHRLISEAAYTLYQERGFADGYELDDWLQAEATIEHVLVDPRNREPPTDA
jgi:hypothetical protein